MLRNLYARTLALAASPRATWWLAVVAFAEASCFPIPPDALLIPMAMARPREAWRFAAICTVASVIGGALGYFIGYAVFDQLAQPLIRFYGYGDRFAAFQALYAQYGLWVILIKGLTPIPYKIVTIASGAAHFNFWLFMAGEHCHARHALLPGGGAAARVRHAGARLHRAAPGAGDRRVGRWRGRRIPVAQADVGRTGQLPVIDRCAARSCRDVTVCYTPSWDGGAGASSRGLVRWGIAAAGA